MYLNTFASYRSLCYEWIDSDLHSNRIQINNWSAKNSFLAFSNLSCQFLIWQHCPSLLFFFLLPFFTGSLSLTSAVEGAFTLAHTPVLTEKNSNVARQNVKKTRENVECQRKFLYHFGDCLFCFDKISQCTMF